MRTLLTTILGGAGILGLGLSAGEAGQCYQPTYTPVYDYSNYYRQNIIIAVPVNPDYYYSVGPAMYSEESPYDPPAKTPTKAVIGKNSFDLFGGADVSREVQAILERNCLPCHKPGAAKPGVQIFTSDRKLWKETDAGHRQRVYSSVEDGSMPKGGEPLSPQDKQVILEWANAR